jgi:hypothetical protein
MAVNKTPDDIWRFEFKLDDGPRDRRIADWIAVHMAQHRNVSEIVKNMIDEVITGHSSITGKAIRETASTTGPGENEVADALANMED